MAIAVMVQELGKHALAEPKLWQGRGGSSSLDMFRSFVCCFAFCLFVCCFSLLRLFLCCFSVLSVVDMLKHTNMLKHPLSICELHLCVLCVADMPKHTNMHCVASFKRP